MTSLFSSGLYRAVSNSDYVTAILLAKSAATRDIDFETLGGRCAQQDLKQVLEVLSCHTSASATTAGTYMAFLRSSFARFSPFHQRAAILPFLFQVASESSDFTSGCPDSPSDNAREKQKQLDRLGRLIASLYPLSASARWTNWIQTQKTRMQYDFPDDSLPRKLPDGSVHHSFLLRVFRDKGKFLSRRPVGWTTLTYTMVLRHRTIALRLSSLFSSLALRLCMQPPLPSSSSSSTAWQPQVLTQSSVAYLRHLRGRCHSQVCTANQHGNPVHTL